MRLVRSILAGRRFVGRAAIGFGLATVITATTAIGSALFARGASTRREAILAAYAGDVTRAFQAQLAAEKMVASGRGYVLTPDTKELQRFHVAEIALDRSLDELEHLELSPQERNLLIRTKASASHYRALFDDIIESRGHNTSARVAVFPRQAPARPGGPRRTARTARRPQAGAASGGTPRRAPSGRAYARIHRGADGSRRRLERPAGLGLYAPSQSHLPARAGGGGARHCRDRGERGLARRRGARLAEPARCDLAQGGPHPTRWRHDRA